MRWATGLLVDNAHTSTGGMDLMNRGWDGSGHGWAIGFGVLWNGTADSFLIQQPPGAENWAIGSTGMLDDRRRAGQRRGRASAPAGDHRLAERGGVPREPLPRTALRARRARRGARHRVLSTGRDAARVLR